MRIQAYIDSVYNQMMEPRKILGVDADATQSEIQRAYRAKAEKHHPDSGGDAWAFQQVQDAYKALTDPDNPPVESGNGNARPKSKPTAGESQAKPDRPSNPNQSPQHAPKHHHSLADRWHEILVGELPLQTETTVFILINCLDIFMTHTLLRMGAVESNPIANFFIQKWEFQGAIVFKLAIVAFVCVCAQLVALKKPRTAKGLLIAGSVLVGLVVLYSISLYSKHFW